MRHLLWSSIFFTCLFASNVHQADASTTTPRSLTSHQEHILLDKGIPLNVTDTIKVWAVADRDTDSYLFNIDAIGADPATHEFRLRATKDQDALTQGLVRVAISARDIGSGDAAADIIYQDTKRFYLDLETGFLRFFGRDHHLVLSPEEASEHLRSLPNTFLSDESGPYILTPTKRLLTLEHTSTGKLRFRVIAEKVTIKDTSLKSLEKARRQATEEDLKEFAPILKAENFDAFDDTPSFQCAAHREWLNAKFDTACLKDHFRSASAKKFVIDPGHLGGAGFCDYRAVNKWGSATGYDRDPNTPGHYREGHGSLFVALRMRNMMSCILEDEGEYLWLTRNRFKLTREGTRWMYGASTNLNTITPRSCSGNDSTYNRSYRMGYIKSLTNAGGISGVISIHTNASSAHVAQFPLAFSPKYYHSRSIAMSNHFGEALEKYMYGNEMDQNGEVVDRQAFISGQDRSNYIARMYSNIFFFNETRSYSGPKILNEVLFHDTARAALLLSDHKNETEIARHWQSGETEVIRSNSAMHYAAEAMVGGISSFVGCGL